MTSAKQLFSGINIGCIRGGRLLFSGLSFGLNPGGIIHLSGANGAGKTSLLRIMSGVLPMAAGEIEWDGGSFLENGLGGHAERYSFLPPDDSSLKPLETALENLRFWASFRGIADGACPGALEKMHILNLKDTPVRYLSAGQKRRLSLARVFLKPAPLWLLDEPFNGLDRDSRSLFVQAMDAHCAGGGMAVVASHQAIEPPKCGTLQRITLTPTLSRRAGEGGTHVSGRVRV
jgi:heme exporter protein A